MLLIDGPSGRAKRYVDEKFVFHINNLGALSGSTGTEVLNLLS